MKRLIDRLENTMNDFNLKKKLHILYIYCMLIPLIITDSVILFIVVQSERVEQRHVMENDASAVIYNLSREVENAAMKAKNIYMNGYIEEFLNRQYETPLDYVTGHQAFMKNSLFETVWVRIIQWLRFMRTMILLSMADISSVCLMCVRQNGIDICRKREIIQYCIFIMTSGKVLQCSRGAACYLSEN